MVYANLSGKLLNLPGFTVVFPVMEFLKWVPLRVRWSSKPIDIATRETLQFVTDHLPSTTASILEVGAGNGELASALQAAGHSVVALDACAESVARARGKGVQARQVTWPQYQSDPVDRVLFTRSLHHMEDLSLALDRAVALVKPGGLVLVEDFEFLEMDAEGCRWFYHQLSLLAATGALTLAKGSFLDNLLQAKGDIYAWRGDHAHDLHTAGAMIQAMRRRLADVRVERAAYLYRYLIPHMAEDQLGADQVAAFLGLEQVMAANDWLPLIGRRIVGRAAP